MQENKPNPVITILVVHHDTPHFIVLLLKALEKLTTNAYEVHICDNSSTKDNFRKLNEIVASNGKVQVILRQQPSGEPPSIAHGAALDLLIDKVSTKYTLVIDSDCVLLKKYWDKILINELSDKVKIVGSTLPLNRCGKKPVDFPLPFISLFETAIFKGLNISCLPCNLQAGEDTCWQWRSKFLAAGYQGKVLETKNSRDFQETPFASVVGVDQYFDSRGDLIAAHLGRGSSGGFAKYYHKWFFKIPKISRFIIRLVAAREGRRWIKLCEALIEEQAKAGYNVK